MQGAQEVLQIIMELWKPSGIIFYMVPDGFAKVLAKQKKKGCQARNKAPLLVPVKAVSQVWMSRGGGREGT